MNSLFRLGGLAIALLSASCASQTLPENAEESAAEVPDSAVQLELVGSNDPLTNGPWDELFDLTLSASPESFVMQNLNIAVASPGSLPMLAKCALTDGNANQLFDVGESVSCTERYINTIDGAAVGLALSVSLVEFNAGVRRHLGDVSWTPEH